MRNGEKQKRQRQESDSGHLVKSYVSAVINNSREKLKLA